LTVIMSFSTPSGARVACWMLKLYCMC
jgi:hypothetical protein